MSLAETYQRVANRSLAAAKASLAAGIHEKAGFMCYHAFESAGCALTVSKGKNKHVGHRIPHMKKVQIFLRVANQLGNGRNVAAVAMIVSSLRNQCLYPAQLSGGSIQKPEDSISKPSVQDMMKRVQGIVGWVKGQL